MVENVYIPNYNLVENVYIPNYNLVEHFLLFMLKSPQDKSKKCIVGPFVWQKSTFGWLCNNVIQNRGHANIPNKSKFRYVINLW